MDAIQSFLSQLTPSARHLFSGQVCGMSPTHYAGTVGYLHFFRGGKLTIIPEGAEPFTLDKPSLVFYPGAWPHHMRGDEQQPAHMLCAVVDYGGISRNPVAVTLPKVIIIPLEEVPSLRVTLDLLTAEADLKQEGWQAATDRLFEYVIVQIIRHAMGQGMINDGILAGLGDAKLARSLTAIHEQMNSHWSLEKLARLSGMSRARFAARFAELIGVTPMEYLLNRRLSQAMKMLKTNETIKTVAAACGFSSPSVFTRAFARHVGQSPSEWLQNPKHELN